MNWLRNVVNGIRQVAKYANFILAILDIFGYAADKLEGIADNKSETKSKRVDK